MRGERVVSLPLQTHISIGRKAPVFPREPRQTLDQEFAVMCFVANIGDQASGSYCLTPRSPMLTAPRRNGDPSFALECVLAQRNAVIFRRRPLNLRDDGFLGRR